MSISIVWRSFGIARRCSVAAARVCLVATVALPMKAPAQGGAVGGPAQSASVRGAATGYLVSGHVLCGDTQRPARFAQITLQSTEEGGGWGGRFSTRTDLDGNFSLPGVPQGDYFVTGQMAGYINQAAAVRAAVSAGGDVGAALPDVPRIHVGAGGGTVALNLQRGGVIAGEVTWDDGSPAGGVGVAVLPAPTTAAGTSAPATSSGLGGSLGGAGGGRFGGSSGSQTDDRGRFRLSGLAPGVYLVRANVQAPAPQRGEIRGFARTLSLSVYAPDKVRRTDAEAVTVAGPEEHDDVDITLGLAGMHAVSGIVSSTAGAVRSGSVSLTDSTDTSLTRRGVIHSDGSFAVPYVPPGNYTLRVNASSQAAQSGYGRGGLNSENEAQGTRFQPLQESVTVTDSDLSGLTLNVVPTTSAP